MAQALLSAPCLVAVLEGLFLLVTADGWRRMAERLYALDGRQLRLLEGAIPGAGLRPQWLVRG